MASVRTMARPTFNFETIEIIRVFVLCGFFDDITLKWTVLIRRIAKARLTKTLIAAATKPEAHQWFTTCRRFTFISATEQIRLFRLWIVRLSIGLTRFRTLIDVHHDEINFSHCYGEITHGLKMSIFRMTRINVDNGRNSTNNPFIRSATIEVRSRPKCRTCSLFMSNTNTSVINAYEQQSLDNA
jgi:hypothetical protein